MVKWEDSSKFSELQTMAEEISFMEIDDDQNNTNTAAIVTTTVKNKGKNVIVSTGTGPKAAPWVEKYRPQSLADVAAHRDIVDTSEIKIHFPLSNSFSLLNEKILEKKNHWGFL